MITKKTLSRLCCGAAIAALLLFASCGKTCRCYRYDGGVDEFDIDELDSQGKGCADMEQENSGRKYSYCERVLF